MRGVCAGLGSRWESLVHPKLPVHPSSSSSPVAAVTVAGGGWLPPDLAPLARSPRRHREHSQFPAAGTVGGDDCGGTLSGRVEGDTLGGALGPPQPWGSCYCSLGGL